MEAVDPEVSVTCMDMSLVKKVFQLALLCTKRHPSERPAMHEVARVLVSLLPAPATKASCGSIKTIDYARFVINNKGQRQLMSQLPQVRQEDSTSDAQWFLQFREVISKNTL